MTCKKACLASCSTPPTPARADGCSLQRLMAEIFSKRERKNKDPRRAIASLENAEKKDAPKKILDVPMAERLRS